MEKEEETKNQNPTIEEIKSQFSTPDVLVEREFSFGEKKGTILLHPELTDSSAVRQVLIAFSKSDGSEKNAKELIEKTIPITECQTVETADEALDMILMGDAAIIVDDFDEIIIANAKTWDQRGVSEPPVETVLSGPREGFTEDIKTNLTLLIRKLKTPSLAIERFKVGKLSNSNTAIVYIKGVANDKVVKQVKEKLEKINTDGVLDASCFEPFLDERPYSMFKQVGKSEKPDIVVSKLLEGRVAVVLDGSPIVLTVPYLFIEDFSSPQDHYERPAYATFIRFIRYFAVVLALFVPAFYVAIQVFNYDVIPLRLLVPLMNATRGTPLPIMLEVILVILFFEMIRECMLRTPVAIGFALGLVGVIVMSETAVSAGILSIPPILVVALSSLGLFMVPGHVNSMSILRVAFTIGAGILGIYGLILMSIFLVHYLVNIESYGSPYLAPFAPFIAKDQKDALFKEPYTHFKERPYSINQSNKIRQR
ncbi:MAG: spore germination protein [Firmicutes bacterium]|nr:spore germination protein [Bacillota bacterium]